MIATPCSTSTGRLSWDLLWWPLGREQRGKRRTFKGEGRGDKGGVVAYSPFCILGRCADHGTPEGCLVAELSWCHLRWGSEQERRANRGMVRIRIHQAPPKSPRLDWKTFSDSVWFPIRVQTMVREGSSLPTEEPALWNHEPACWGWGRKQSASIGSTASRPAKGGTWLRACRHVTCHTYVSGPRQLVAGAPGLDTTCTSDPIRGYSRPEPMLT